MALVTRKSPTTMGSRAAVVDRTSLREVETRLTLDIHPSRSGNVVAGVKEQLNNSLMRYSEQHGGIVLAHSNVSCVRVWGAGSQPVCPYSEQHGGIVLAYSNVLLFGRTAAILTGLNPYLHVSLSARLLLFAPRPGAFLGVCIEECALRSEGMVNFLQNNVGADFIALLVLPTLLTTVSSAPLPPTHPYPPLPILRLALSEGVVNNVGADFIGLLVLGIFNAAVPDQFMRSWKHVEEVGAAAADDGDDDSHQQHWQHKEDPSHRIFVGSRIRVQVDRWVFFSVHSGAEQLRFTSPSCDETSQPNIERCAVLVVMSSERELLSRLKSQLERDRLNPTSSAVQCRWSCHLRGLGAMRHGGLVGS
ncbi:unnamed protein product [Closterium sp. NIES-64]|nr:unnamed protein product [Closterium sp. NIES-64]